jgi:hypothetical protein
MSHPRRALAFLGFALLLPAGGCCHLAALFCGPDTSRWVPVSYSTHGEALDTFMEAVRRDHARIVCESLSEGFKTRLGISGVFEAALAWEKLKDRTTGAHLLGRAAVSGPEILSPRRVRYVLEVAGHRLRVDLARYPFVAMSYHFEGAEEPVESYVESLEKYVTLPSVYPRAVDLHIPHLDLPDGIMAHDIVSIVAAHDWKVDDLQEVEDTGS